MRPNRFPILLGFLVVTFAAGALGGAATSSSVDTWFITLAKPTWNPPGWLFAPVWSVLYILMAIAAWRIWRGPTSAARTGALRLYFVQLGLNALWSGLFFGLRRPGMALVEILIMLGVLGVIQVRFWRIDRGAGAMWIPYLAWVSFATILNSSIWWLNHGGIQN